MLIFEVLIKTPQLPVGVSGCLFLVFGSTCPHEAPAQQRLRTRLPTMLQEGGRVKQLHIGGLRLTMMIKTTMTTMTMTVIIMTLRVMTYDGNGDTDVVGDDATDKAYDDGESDDDTNGDHHDMLTMTIAMATMITISIKMPTTTSSENTRHH